MWLTHMTVALVLYKNISIHCSWVGRRPWRPAAEADRMSSDTFRVAVLGVACGVAAACAFGAAPAPASAKEEGGGAGVRKARKKKKKKSKRAALPGLSPLPAAKAAALATGDAPDVELGQPAGADESWDEFAEEPEPEPEGPTASELRVAAAVTAASEWGEAFAELREEEGDGGVGAVYTALLPCTVRAAAALDCAPSPTRLPCLLGSSVAPAGVLTSRSVRWPQRWRWRRCGRGTGSGPCSSRRCLTVRSCLYLCARPVPLACTSAAPPVRLCPAACACVVPVPPLQPARHGRVCGAARQAASGSGATAGGAASRAWPTGRRCSGQPRARTPPPPRPPPPLRSTGPQPPPQPPPTPLATSQRAGRPPSNRRSA